MGITGSKMLAHLDRITSAEKKPITADVFLTNFCNNACPYCTYKRWEFDSDAKYITFYEFRKIAERLVELGIQGIILTGGGEPTVNPDFDRITSWLESEKIHYGINTNFNKLRYCSPDYLKISLDGYDEDSYAKARGVRAYGKVLGNIEQYLAWKGKNNVKTNVGIQFVALHPEDVALFYEANKHLNVDYIVIRPIESTCGTHYSTDDAKAIAKDTVKTIEALRAQDSRVVANYKWEMLDVHEDRCTANWTQLAVNEFGQVMYCCHKPFQIIGSVFDGDILEKKAQAPTDMNLCDIPCRLTGPNRFMASVEQYQADSSFI